MRELSLAGRVAGSWGRDVDSLGAGKFAPRTLVDLLVASMQTGCGAAPKQPTSPVPT